MVAVATPEFVDTLAEVLPDANGGMLPSVDPGMAGTGDDAALLDPFALDEAATESVDEAVAFDPTVMRQQVAAEMLAAHELQLAQLRSTKDREVHQHKLMAEVATGELGQVYQWLEGAAKQAMEQGQPIMLDPAQIYQFLNQQTQSRTQQIAQRSQQVVQSQHVTEAQHHMGRAVDDYQAQRLGTDLGLDAESVRQLTTRADYQKALVEHKRAAASFAANPQDEQARRYGLVTKDLLDAIADRHAAEIKAEQAKRTEAQVRSAANIARAKARGPQSTVTHGGGSGATFNPQVITDEAWKRFPDDYAARAKFVNEQRARLQPQQR